MQTEQTTITLSPALYNRLNRLKQQGRFDTDQALVQAAFEALERDWEQGQELPSRISNPYMSRPGLSPDDYDT